MMNDDSGPWLSYGADSSGGKDIDAKRPTELLSNRRTRNARFLRDLNSRPYYRRRSLEFLFRKLNALRSWDAAKTDRIPFCSVLVHASICISLVYSAPETHL